MSFGFASDSSPFDTSQSAIRAAYLADEPECVKALVKEAALDSPMARRVQKRAQQLVRQVRAEPAAKGGLDVFLQEYDLATREGIVLMCLAEALLRIPDSATADRLIRGLILRGEWDRHLGKSPSFLVNASTWGLMLSGKIVRALSSEEAATLVMKLASRLGDSALRSALRAAMGILGAEFVMGETIEQALERTSDEYRYSFDMLGEAALTARDAQRYCDAYLRAIRAVGQGAGVETFSAPGVSIKLSALHPRYEYSQRERVLKEVVPRLATLAAESRNNNVLVTLDAEEAERLELSLELFRAVYESRELRGYEGFGLAVQAYQKRAPQVIDWLAQLAKERRKKIPLRLVKGAYWDTEVKRAQVQGLAGYPVFTRKAHTDISYLACGRRILNHGVSLYPQFATHNAHTVAYFIEVAKDRDFEFQRLHGMGEALYSQIVKEKPCRVYAPVGSFDTLLPYLVRRLLENGANTSFVNRIADTRLPVEKVIADPVASVEAREPASHPRIPLPRDLYPGRRNSAGLNLGDPRSQTELAQAMSREMKRQWFAAPLIAGEVLNGKERASFDPADRTRQIGSVIEADESALAQALQSAHSEFPHWNATLVGERAKLLEGASDLIEQHRAELAALIVREGGRTIPDALSEIREAADYCR
ncbi:MAG: bifunctional proline dehydrogenase/L-glutamate gamma-semialdehyde dehydrogenase PutA, partial [Burkholderiales bacterium]